jgi:hypothetical protein
MLAAPGQQTIKLHHPSLEIAETRGCDQILTPAASCMTHTITIARTINFRLWKK